MTKKEQIQLAVNNLERLLEWISRYDTKSSIILGIDTGMIAILISFTPHINAWNLFMIFSAITSVIILGTTLFFIQFGSYPRTKASNKSLIYFGTISEFSSDEFKKQFCNQKEEDYLNDLLEQCHRNAEIITLKFKNLKIAYRLLSFAIIPWIITIFLFKIASL